MCSYVLSLLGQCNLEDISLEIPPLLFDFKALTNLPSLEEYISSHLYKWRPLEHVVQDQGDGPFRHINRHIMNEMLTVSYSAEVLRRDVFNPQQYPSRPPEPATAKPAAPTTYAERGKNAALLEEISYPSDDIPQQFLCPITCEIMTDPVRFEQDCEFSGELNKFTPKAGRESHVFERSAIAHYMQNFRLVHPLTREDISNTTLTTDVKLKEQIDAFVRKAQSEMSSKQNQNLTLFKPAQELQIQITQQQNKQFTDKIYAFATGQLAIESGSDESEDSVNRSLAVANTTHF